MITNFLPNPDKTQEIQTIQPTDPQKEPLQVLIIGSPRVVTSTIHTLYRLNFAHVSEWSPLQPAQKPGQVMSILTRQIVSP